VHTAHCTLLARGVQIRAMLLLGEVTWRCFSGSDGRGSLKASVTLEYEVENLSKAVGSYPHKYIGTACLCKSFFNV
jgi:hypothetical protein